MPQEKLSFSKEELDSVRPLLTADQMHTLEVAGTVGAEALMDLQKSSLTAETRNVIADLIAQRNRREVPDARKSGVGNATNEL